MKMVISIVSIFKP